MVTMDPDLVGNIEVTHAQNGNFLLGEGFRRSVGKSNAWSLLLRYQAQTERHGVPSGLRAVEEFDRLKALWQEIPNEPIEPQPEQTEPARTLDETNPPPPKNHKTRGLPTPRPPNRSRIPSASRMSLKTAKPLICVTPNPEPPLADG